MNHERLQSRDRLPGGSRYEVLVKIASGGMGTVYIGRLRGAVGFRRLVAIKRAHAHLVEQPMFSRMLIEEARLSALIHHANVVATHDVEELDGELLLVMEYVEGASLSQLMTAAESSGELLPTGVILRIVLDVAAGLAAAHDLASEDGKVLGLVHRDVTPQNILVGIDGVARLTDFGVAKCLHTESLATATGGLKGKVGYIAPEYIESGRCDQRSDIFSLGVVLWEALVHERLFRGPSEVEAIRLVLTKPIPPPSSARPDLGASLDGPVLGALARDPGARIATARQLAAAVEAAAQGGDRIASHSAVGEQVKKLVGATIQRRRAAIKERDERPSPATPLTAPTAAVVPRVQEETLSIPLLSAAIEPATTRESAAPPPIAPAPAATRRSRRPLAVLLVAIVALGVVVPVAFSKWGRPGPLESPRPDPPHESPPPLASSSGAQANADPDLPPASAGSAAGAPSPPSRPPAHRHRAVSPPRPRPTAEPNPY